MLDEIMSDPTLSFQFADPEPLPTPILQLDGVKYSYFLMPLCCHLQ